MCVVCRAAAQSVGPCDLTGITCTMLMSLKYASARAGGGPPRSGVLLWLCHGDPPSTCPFFHLAAMIGLQVSFGGPTRDVNPLRLFSISGARRSVGWFEVRFVQISCSIHCEAHTATQLPQQHCMVPGSTYHLIACPINLRTNRIDRSTVACLQGEHAVRCGGGRLVHLGRGAGRWTT